jgi:hypothetical protein
MHDPSTAGITCTTRHLCWAGETDRFLTAIFSANRHPIEQSYQITLGGSPSRRSACQPPTRLPR